MRRGAASGESWTLIADCPLNNSLTDQSGYNNDLAAANGSTATFITDPTDSNIKVSQLTSDATALVFTAPPNQIDYINNFRIEVDFYKLTSWYTNSYPNLIDGSGSGANNGIETQRVNSIMYWGIVTNKSTSTAYFLQANISSLLVSTWYRLMLENYDNNMHVVIIKISDNSIVHDYTVASTITSSTHTPDLYFGKSAYYSGRYWGGYMKNFKLYI